MLAHAARLLLLARLIIGHRGVFVLPQVAWRQASNSVVVGNFGFVLPKTSIMVAWHLYFNPGVCNTHWLIWALHRSRNGCLALSSEQRRVALVVSAGIPSIGSPLVGASVVCRLIQVGSTTVGHLSERSGRFCKLVHGRGGTCYLCGVVCRCGRERGLPPGPSGPQFPKSHPAE